jgi:GT2 family glycosyltransferase/glycosyltransferase involved in cell wall biosynthesis
MLDGRLLRRPTSGQERYVWQLASELIGSGLVGHCSLLTGWPPPERRPAGAWPAAAVDDRHAVAVVKRHAPDLVHLTWAGHSLAHYLPLLAAPASVLTIHDLILYHHPEYMPPAQRPLYRAALAIGAQWATRVVVDSQAVRSEVISYLGVPAERIDVVPLGVDDRFAWPVDLARRWEVRDRYHLSPSYFLSVGKDFPHKNLTSLVRAFADLRRHQLPSHELVLVGEAVWPATRPELWALIRRLGVEDAVHFLEHVADDDLPVLYQLADALVFPSLLEGFGLPPLEAMAAGTPVVCSNQASLPEVVGDAGELVDARSSDQLAAAMLRVVENPAHRQSLIERGKLRASALSWAQTARLTAESYRRAQQAALAHRAALRYPADDVLRGFPTDRAAVADVWENAVASNRLPLVEPTSKNQSGEESAPPTARSVRVSIVIPTYNRWQYTQACVSALDRTLVGRGDVEILIVDNASRDETGAFLGSLAEPYRVIRNSENRGFAAACNQGVRAASGELLLFLNNDTIPQAGWLAALIAALERDPTIGVVGARLLYPDGTIQHAGIVLDDQLVPRHAFCRRPGDYPPANVEREYQGVTGACFLVHRATFHALGGFDERYRNGYEDVDFCFKARWEGYRVVYAPGAVLTHFESTSDGRFTHDAANRRQFLSRWRAFAVRDDPSSPQRRLPVATSPREFPGSPSTSDGSLATARDEAHRYADLMVGLPSPYPSEGSRRDRFFRELLLKISRKGLATWASYITFLHQARFNQATLRLLDEALDQLDRLNRENQDLRATLRQLQERLPERDGPGVPGGSPGRERDG